MKSVYVAAIASFLLDLERCKTFLEGFCGHILFLITSVCSLYETDPAFRSLQFEDLFG